MPRTPNNKKKSSPKFRLGGIFKRKSPSGGSRSPRSISSNRSSQSLSSQHDDHSSEDDGDSSSYGTGYSYGRDNDGMSGLIKHRSRSITSDTISSKGGSGGGSGGGIISQNSGKKKKGKDKNKDKDKPKSSKKKGLSSSSDKENRANLNPSTSIRSSASQGSRNNGTIKSAISQSDLYIQNAPKSPMSLRGRRTGTTSLEFPTLYELNGGGDDDDEQEQAQPEPEQPLEEGDGDDDDRKGQKSAFRKRTGIDMSFANMNMNMNCAKPNIHGSSDASVISSLDKSILEMEGGTRTQFLQEEREREKSRGSRRGSEFTDSSDVAAAGAACKPFVNTWNNVFCGNINGDRHDSRDDSYHDDQDGATVSGIAEKLQNQLKSGKGNGNDGRGRGLGININNNHGGTAYAATDTHTDCFGGVSLSLTASDSIVDSEEDRRKNTDLMVLTRSALSRPFGRTSLPASIAKRWLVEVQVCQSHDNENGDDSTRTSDFLKNRAGKSKACEYDIMVQKEEFGTSKVQKGKFGMTSGKKGGASSISSTSSASISHTSQSLHNELSISASMRTTTANVKRTLRDFMWLEQALRKEYQGSLLIPTLSLAITGGTDWTTALDLDKEAFERGQWDPMSISNEILDEAVNSDMEEAVDTKLLADWLSDILNGVRGRGELIMKYDGSTEASNNEGIGIHVLDVAHSEAMEEFLYKTSDHLPQPILFVDFNQAEDNPSSRCSPVSNASWIKKALVGNGGGNGKEPDITLSEFMRMHIFCLSALDKYDFDMNENPSFTTFESDAILSRRSKMYTKEECPTNSSWLRYIQMDDIKAQRSYISAQRENTLRVMYRLRILLEKEILLSAAWKRLAISISMLFSAEKDIEATKIGKGKVKKRYKVSRTAVDDNLRVLARQKVDRSVPSLKVLSGMLNAYYADFSSVDPSLHEFAKELQRVAKISDNGDWRSALSLMVNGMIDDGDSESMKKAEQQVAIDRLQKTEVYLKGSLMQLCQAMKIRVSRMSWKFFKMESGQVSLLINATDQVRTNLKCRIEPSSFEEEKNDNDTELELIKQTMVLGSRKSYKYQAMSKSCNSSHTSSETSDISDFERSVETESEMDDGTATVQSPLMEKVLNISRERVGQWDEQFANAILTAVGVKRISFEEEDTSREIRTMNKLLMTLRESLSRCSDSIEMLKSILQGEHNDQNESSFSNVEMDHTRNGFLSALALLFSGTCTHRQIEPIHEEMLSCLGIDVHDSDGWLKSTERTNPAVGICGIVTRKYQDVRGRGTEGLLESLSKKLNDYNVIIREMENFIWMRRVGNHLEQHFSRLRADALADWEQKTDITTAINIATKKRLTLLVRELKDKLDSIGSRVSYSSVKMAKERHLGSKAIKGALESLANRRLHRLKESSTKNTLSLINEWALSEESTAKIETKYLSEAITEVERNVRRDDRIRADGGAHLFASSMSPVMMGRKRSAGQSR
eukprot:CAMPEP_0194079022 /NCGR_PEP_ID=MMETSP0149-20130528/5274_1 /TAXON_ID=122233 /ORGANISM="Chaetoceros debilis, Strain MM31A-1" /LENGTH=1462 /DNA_ID=CAMNT_0038760381 /DNA_START=208 /DNA_END=4596 /DNA_ORIENTATION=+